MSTNQPLVSVIISTYNRRNYVQQAVKSVLAQTYRNFEIIIVDDGSTDGTKAALTSLSDRRIRYFWHENRGRSASRNRAVAEAQGELIAFLDDDDLYLPDKLQAQVSFLVEHPKIGMVSSGYRVITNDGKLLGERRPWEYVSGELNLRQALFGCPLALCAVMMRRVWFELVDGFDMELDVFEDTDLFLRLFKSGCRVTWVPQILWENRTHSANSQQDGTRYSKARIAALDKIFSDKELSSNILKIRDKVYANNYLVGAIQQFATGQVTQAKQDLLQALELDPELLDNNCEQIQQALIGRIGDYNLSDSRSFVKTVFDNLPSEVEALKQHRSKMLKTASKVVFFRSHHLGNRREVLLSFLRVFWREPLWLMNKGVISIFLQALLSSNFTHFIQRWTERRLSDVTAD